jgi:hypothetical protein
MKLTLLFSLLLSLLSAFSASAQAPRPPIQNLSGLTGDVNITAPLDLQPLRYDAANVEMD